MPGSPQASILRVLILGDIVGHPGRAAVVDLIPEVRERWRVDLVIANAENAAAGSGITPRLFRELARAGLDLMTLGDHSWKRRDNLDVLKQEETLLRPHNYPDKALGKGTTVVKVGDTKVGVVTVLGRIFMAPVSCPFETVDAALAEFADDVKIRIVEVHAEATSEKIALGWHLRGRASCVFGTHTHVPTADDRILPGGTAYISDLGMTGPYDGVIGRKSEPVIHKFTTSMHATFTVAEHNAHVCGALLDVDVTTGKAVSFKRVDLRHGEKSSPHGNEALTELDSETSI